MTVDGALGSGFAAGNIDDLWEGDMTGVELGGKAVLLVNVDGDVYAYRNSCPHQEGVLSDGDLDERTLTCIRHLWSFDVTTGCGVNPSDAKLVPYPCRVGSDGTILVDVGEQS